MVNSLRDNGLVSVIIPVYNREQLIVHAIESVLAQSYQNWELIISDNKSTDRTLAVIQRYAAGDARIKIIVNASNVGPVANWEIAVRASRGEFVKFLFSDDWLEANYLEESLKAIQQNNDIAYVFSPAAIVFEDRQVLFYKCYQNSCIIHGREFIDGVISEKGFPVSPGCALFRRNEIVNNITSNISAEEGVDFARFGAGPDLLMYLLPLLDRSKLVGFVASTQAYFLVHDGSFTISNDLTSYYEYAKAHFLNLYRDRKITTKMYFRYTKNQDCRLFFEPYRKRLEINDYRAYITLCTTNVRIMDFAKRVARKIKHISWLSPYKFCLRVLRKIKRIMNSLELPKIK